MNMNYVRFDVGCYLHVCHRDTLNKYPNSTLAKYVTSEFDSRKSCHDYIVIDRDGKHFGSILNFMRDPTSLNLKSWTEDDLNDLTREADYYCLDELCISCQEEMRNRSCTTMSSTDLPEDYTVPVSRRLETIVGLPVIRNLLASVKKQTIVISSKNAKRFNIESWFYELLCLCNHDVFNVYCFADNDSDSPLLTTGTPRLTLKNFIVAWYDPTGEAKFKNWVQKPADEKFKARRSHYKYKIFKFWFVVQNGMTDRLERQSTQVLRRVSLAADGAE